jgi:hypothetical protein
MAMVVVFWHKMNEEAILFLLSIGCTVIRHGLENAFHGKVGDFRAIHNNDTRLRLELYFEKKMSFEVSIDEDRKSVNCI